MGGCARPILIENIDTNKNYDSKHIVDKSYTIGKQQEAFIGESMIRVKDYNVVEKMSDKLKASEGFSYNEKFFFKKGETFELEGTCVLDGKYYYVAKHQSMKADVIQFKILVDDEGVILNKMMGQVLHSGFNNIVTHDSVSYSPKSVRLINEKITETSVSKGSLNYELVYTGKDKDSLKLLYREYTSEDMARPSFYQTLTYDLNSKKIRFKNITMQVNLMDNEKITFIVISDS